MHTIVQRSYVEHCEDTNTVYAVLDTVGVML